MRWINPAQVLFALGVAGLGALSVIWGEFALPGRSALAGVIRALAPALALAMSLSLALGATAAPAPAPAPAPPAADAPYVLAYGDRFAVKVMLNGQGPFDFLLDTAATRTILYEHARQRLGTPANHAELVTVIGISGSMRAPTLHLDELRLADLRVASRTIVVLPDTASREDEPDGILGLDILRRYFVLLDHDEMRLRLYARAADAPADYRAWPQVALAPRKLGRTPDALWFLSAYFDRREATTLFDLGAGVTILNWSLAGQLGLHKNDFPDVHLSQEVEDVLGQDAPVIVANNLAAGIGPRVWAGTDAVVADAPIFKLLDLTQVPAALLGPGLLKDKSLAVDFAGGRLYIAPKHRTIVPQAD